ncbi:hypothetical protein LX87_01025 [Larkinella arboricola]|uniref:Uncharacterized protein n=1 Tax=Larkinella arboricola TaxID=643671 RepID=A0A327X9X5_LARAB|nr:hypothetical protein [Larkinella arboricola]RAK02904.1 hypothetical protein LX87_01025 [Larkinella arboricola]
MKFEKGREKTGGRQLGSTNRTSTDLKNRIATLIDNQFDSIQADLELLEPKDRVMAYLKFIEYVLPKQREQKIDLSTLTDDQIDALLDKAMAKLD